MNAKKMDFFQDKHGLFSKSMQNRDFDVQNMDFFSKRETVFLIKLGKGGVGNISNFILLKEYTPSTAMFVIWEYHPFKATIHVLCNSKGGLPWR